MNERHNTLTYLLTYLLTAPHLILGSHTHSELNAKPEYVYNALIDE